MHDTITEEKGSVDMWVSHSMALHCYEGLRLAGVNCSEESSETNDVFNYVLGNLDWEGNVQ